MAFGCDNVVSPVDLAKEIKCVLLLLLAIGCAVSAW